MYIVIDKNTKKIIHSNPAPVEMNLKPVEVFHQFDPRVMQIGKTDANLPEHFDIDQNGEIIEWPLEKKVKEGVVSLKPDEKVEHGQIISKSVDEQVKDGLIQLTPFQKIQNNQIVSKTLSEQLRDGLIKILPSQKIIGEGINEQIVEKSVVEKIKEGLLSLAANQKVVGDQIVYLTDRQMLDEKKIDLNEYKKRRIEYFSNLSFLKRQSILPDYKIQNAALGIYDAAKTEEIKKTIQSCKDEFNRIRDAIEKAKSADAVDSVTDNFPGDTENPPMKPYTAGEQQYPMVSSVEENNPAKLSTDGAKNSSKAKGKKGK